MRDTICPGFHGLHPARPAAGKKTNHRSPGVQNGAVILLPLLLQACTSGGGQTGPLASFSDVSVQSIQPGATPFLSQVGLKVEPLDGLDSVEYTIAPKAGSASRAVDVRYSLGALQQRGYAKVGGSAVTLPGCGRYADVTNPVTIRFQFIDGSAATLPVTIATAGASSANWA